MFNSYTSVVDCDHLSQLWSKCRLKNICRFAYGDSLPSEQYINGEVAVFGSNGLVSYHDTANTLFPCIIIGRKGSFGKIQYSSSPVFAIDTTYYVDRRHTNSNLRWLYYLLVTSKLDAFSKDSTIPGLNREDAYQVICLLPTPDEQLDIAKYLDYADQIVRGGGLPEAEVG